MFGQEEIFPVAAFRQNAGLCDARPRTLASCGYVESIRVTSRPNIHEAGDPNRLVDPVRLESLTYLVGAGQFQVVVGLGLHAGEDFICRVFNGLIVVFWEQVVTKA